jgi:lysophospholipase L1-like esterase
MDTKPAPRFGRPIAATFSVCATAAIVAILEAGSYVLGTFPGPENPLRGGNITAFGRHDPLLFWSLRPHALGPDGVPWVNARGLRGPDMPPKAQGELRILSLGESTTFAAGMPYEQCYSHMLERLLDEDGRGRPVRVINGGVPGYSLFQGFQYLKHRGVALEPDVVMIYFGFNDFLPVTFLADRAGGDRPQAGGYNDWELFELRQEPVERLKAFLTAHSNLYRGMLRWTAADRVPTDRSIRTDTERPRVPAEHRERLLHMLLDLCRGRGVDLVIVVPWYLTFEKHIPLLRSFAAANDVAVVDLPAMLPPRLAKARSAYFVDNTHPTPEGHRLMAEAIYEVLARRGM